MPKPPSGDDLRRWAAMCAEEKTKTAASVEERERLFKMEQAMLALAEHQDWLDGKTARASGDKRIPQDDL